ncbi:zinc finger, CCHC-type containing protein [Tanacetum coccineum]
MSRISVSHFQVHIGFKYLSKLINDLWFYLYKTQLRKHQSRDAIFDENHFSSIPKPKDIIPNSVESQRDDHSNDVPSETPEPRKGKRVRRAKSYGFDFQLYLVEGSRDQKEAIDDEIGSIMENNTWVLSDLPTGYKPLGCKWIFKRKMKVDGTCNTLKSEYAAEC